MVTGSAVAAVVAVASVAAPGRPLPTPGWLKTAGGGVAAEFHPVRWPWTAALNTVDYEAAASGFAAGVAAAYAVIVFDGLGVGPSQLVGPPTSPPPARSIPAPFGL